MDIAEHINCIPALWFIGGLEPVEASGCLNPDCESCAFPAVETESLRAA